MFKSSILFLQGKFPFDTIPFRREKASPFLKRELCKEGFLKSINQKMTCFSLKKTFKNSFLCTIFSPEQKTPNYFKKGETLDE